MRDCEDIIRDWEISRFARMASSGTCRLTTVMEWSILVERRRKRMAKFSKRRRHQQVTRENWRKKRQGSLGCSISRENQNFWTKFFGPTKMSLKSRRFFFKLNFVLSQMKPPPQKKNVFFGFLTFEGEVFKKSPSYFYCIL